MASSIGSGDDENRLYGDLTWLWPIISPPEEYVEETEKLVEEIKRHSPSEVRNVLHLGCGGGHVDHTLKRHFTVTGVDVSEPMLSLARHLNPDVTYLRGDMRSLQLPQTFDAVLIHDAISYMLNEQDLRAVFATAFAHLKPGGVMVTFAETDKQRLVKSKTECSTHTRDDLEVVFVEYDYDPNPDDTTYDVTFIYLIRRKGQVQVETDHHVWGVFDLEAWPRLIRDVGFEVRQSTWVEEIPLYIGIKPT